jgi:phage-related tail protein
LQVARTGAGDASTAANNVLNLLSKLTAPATVKRMKKFGVDWEAVMKKAKEDGADPFIVALDQIQKVTGGDSFKIGEIFEDMQVKAALIPLLRSRKLFDEIRKASLESGKTIEEDFNKSLNSWPEILNSANNSFSKLGKTIGDQLIPSVGKLTVAFAKTVDRVSKWAKENPKLFRSIVIGTAAVVGLTAAVVAVGIAFAAVSFAVAGFTAAWAALGVVAAAAAVPVGAVIGIIAGAGLVIAGAALLIRKFWEPIATFFEGLWTGIKSGWESAGGPALWHEVTTAVGTAATKIKEWLKPVTGEFENVFAIGKVVGEFIGVKLVQLLGAILNPIDTVKQYLTGLKDEFVTAFNTIKNAAEPVLNWLAEKLQWITEKIGSAVDALKGIGNSLPQWMGGGGGEPAALPNKTSFVPPAMRGEGARQINVNVNGAPGQNEEALAAAVIRRIKQEQDMLGRGNLNDAAFA